MAVEPVKWIGRCDRCGELSPEERDNEEEAQRDVDECPCLIDAPVDDVPAYGDVGVCQCSAFPMARGAADCPNHVPGATPIT